MNGPPGRRGMGGITEHGQRRIDQQSGGKKGGRKKERKVGGEEARL